MNTEAFIKGRAAIERIIKNNRRGVAAHQIMQRIKDLFEACDELVATHELREQKGETITPLQRRAMEQARAILLKVS